MIQSMIQGLTEIAKKDDKIIFLIVDDIEPYEGLHESFPDRTFLVGIAECNAVSMAGGLASCGYKPYVIGGDSFLAYRAFEFIRSQVCLEKRNVKLIGIGAGLAIGVHGSMHTATEDVAVLRALPDLTVITPATETEVKQVMQVSAESHHPMFIRLGRSCGEDFYLNSDHQFHLEKLQEIKTGSDLAVICHGSIVCDVVNAVEGLDEHKIGVINLSTIKPMDEAGLLDLSGRYKKWLTVEEHNLCGGLGSAVAEVVMDHNLDVKLRRMGMCDAFSRATGGHADIKRSVGLGIDDIRKACKRMMEG